MSFLWMYPDVPHKLEPEFWDRLQGLQRRVGGDQDLRVFDGYRSVAEQDRRRNQMEQQGLNPDEYYAPPGQSSHNYGLGADVLGNLQDAHRYAPDYGLYMPMKQDPWHIEPAYVTQMGLPKDDITDAETRVLGAHSSGQLTEDALIQTLRIHAMNEAQAEQFNRVDSPQESLPKSMIQADTAGTREGSQPNADATAGRMQKDVQKLNDQAAVDKFNAEQLGGAMQQMGQAPAANVKPGPGGQGWQNIDAFLMNNGIQIGPATKGQTDGGSHAPGSYHYQGTARDYGTAGSDPQAIYNAILPYAQDPNGPIAELFWEGGSGSDWKNGRNIGRTIGGHGDHVHVALKPGRSLSEIAPSGGTQPAAGYQRMTLQEAVIDPGFAIATIADLHRRGAEKSYARQVPLRPMGEQAGRQDALEQKQTGRVEGQPDVLPPDAQKTPAGLTKLAVNATEGIPTVTSESPPQPLIEDLQLQGAGGAPKEWVDYANAQKMAGGGGDLDSWIRQAMSLTGVGEDQFQWIKKKALQESGGRNILQQIKDVNSGGNEAMGPMQIIPGTFRANMVPGYGDRNNPVHSIAAAINYIKRRYKGDFRGVAMRGGGY